LSSVTADILERERDPHASDSSLRYMPGLDVVRGTAILMVLCAHGIGENAILFWGHTNRILMFFRGIMFTGVYGVHIFFVLSGFLITGILLDSRDRADFYRSFYLRRILRILPAYFLLLTVLKTSHTITWRFLIASLLYFSNMPRLFGADTEYGSLWSLSVEEQFYLIWPFLVRKLNRKALAWLSITIVALTPILRFGLLYAPRSFSDITYKAWDVMDFFAAGALLALAVRSSHLRSWVARLSPWILTTGLLLVFGLMFVISPSATPASKLGEALITEPWLIVATGFVGVGALQPGIARISIARPLIFLGNISYGLYLYHQGVFMVIDKRLPTPPLDDPHRVGMLMLRIFIEIGLSILIAWVSRRTLEEFFLRLKPKSQPHALTTT
jgi:peptidoglycan/LPS O-acetylase OafA/YrhL